jgi:amino acid transporter
MAKSTTPVFVRNATGLIRNISAWDALIANISFMGFMYAATALTFGAAVFPGAYLPVGVLLVLPASIVIGVMYAYLTASMPRTGGDYVFVSRIMHPSLGFMVNFYFTIILMSWIGSSLPFATQYGLASLFGSYGVIWNNSSFLSIATQLGGFTSLSFVVSAIIILASVSLVFLGTKVVIRTSWIMFVLSMIGILVYLGVAVAAGHDTFVANFNVLSGTTVDKVLKAAQSAGYPEGYSLGPTVLGTVYIFLGTLGYTGSAYFAGEVKGGGKSQITAIVGAILAFGVVVFPFYLISYQVFGGDIIGGLAYLAVTGNASMTLPVFPSQMFLTTFVTQNPAVIGFMDIAYVLTTIASTGIIIPFIVVRNLFSWSFDRVLPEKFVALNNYGTPFIAVALTLVTGEAFCFLYYFTPALLYLTYSTLGWFIATAIVALAAILFPYRRKDIFEASPSFVKKKIAEIPIITLLGVIGFIVSVGVSYATITPAYVGILTFTYVAAVIVTLMAGPILYYIARSYQKSRGLAIDLAYAQLPPE